MTVLNEYTLPKVERSGNITILTFTADAIRDVEDIIARELRGLSCDGPGYLLLLNFANVKYLSSIELGTLVGLHKQTEATGGRLILFNLRPMVLKLFTLCRLDTYLTICQEGPVVLNE